MSRYLYYFPLRSHMWMLKDIIFSFAWKTNLPQKFFLCILALHSNLLGQGKNSFDDLKAIIPKSPAFYFEAFCQFHNFFDWKHLQSRPCHFKSCCGSRETST